MMPVRKNLCHLENRRPQAGHAGLLLSRYLFTPVKDDKHSDERKKLFAFAHDANRNTLEIYKPAFDRWEMSLTPAHPPKMETISEKLKISSRLIVGLGDESPTEVGIRLHHTYGTPIIPGSSLKGLAAHYAHQIYGGMDLQDQVTGDHTAWRPNGAFHTAIFGTTKEGGLITFHDAWILPASLEMPTEGLLRDVMTPHHGDYYMAPEGDTTKAPTDFDDPNPIAFLSVAGTFLVALSCDRDLEVLTASDNPTDTPARQILNVALDLLKAALEDWGVGGKTNAGYGRMTATLSPTQ